MRDVAPDALISLGATAAAAATRAGTCTAEALTAACLARIDAREPTVRAFVDVQRERALAEARDLDRRAAGERGPLHGVPVAVKEVFDVAGMICAWGTPIREDPVPRKDAVVVARLRAAGAVIVGTTVSTEYAVWTAGPTTNPHDPARTPGGSSSGSAAAVAAGMVPLAIGSQTIGSVVRPAVYCGVLGMKPTKGAISTVGGMALSAFLDHVGFLARNVDDLAVACQVLFAPDPKDQYSEDIPPPVLGRGRRRLQVLLVEGPLCERIETATRVALDRARAAFETAGARVREVELSDRFAAARDCLFTIQRYGIARNHGADRDRAGGRMSAFVRNVIDAGRKISEADYSAALEEARGYQRDLLELLADDAIIMAPAVDSVAPLFSEPGTGWPDLQGLWTLTWLPVVAAPCGRFEGLPVGVQLIAAPKREDLVLEGARLLGETYPSAIAGA